MITRVLMLALLAVPLGCQQSGAPTGPLRAEAGESVAGVTLSVDRAQYTHGDTIEVRLVNTGGSNVGYNLCSSARERETLSGWQRIEPFRMCTAALYPLAPGQTATSREPVDPEWGSARYRIVTAVHVGEAMETRRLTSAIFQVAP